MRLAILPLIVVLASASPPTSIDAAPRPDDPAIDIETWEQSLDTLLSTLPHTSRLADRLAILEEMASLVRIRVTPRGHCLTKLDEILRVAPEGSLLDAVAETLLADPMLDAYTRFFAALDRSDYADLKGRQLGDTGIETRQRILEQHGMIAADAAHRARLGDHPPTIPGDLSAALEAELGRESPRRVRAAALFAGGWGIASLAPKLVEALEKAEDPWTRSLLIEALGRTDPTGKSEKIIESAESKTIAEKLAALPLLGHLEGERVDGVIREALADRRWYVQRAAVEACLIRRDVAAIDLIMAKLPDASPRIRRSIYDVLFDVSGGTLPPDPRDLEKWWKAAREGFEAAPPDRKERDPGRKTRVFTDPSNYFGVELWSDQVAIVFDVSGSMEHGAIAIEREGKTESGTPFEVMRKEIEQLLASLPRKAKFHLISYNDQVTPFQKGLVVQSPTSLRSAGKFLDKLSPSGETNIYDAVQTALTDPEVDTIFLLSDGEPTQGARVESYDILEGVAAQNRFRRAVIHTIQIGRDQDLMRRLAIANGGDYRWIPLMR